jgi:hypothetical protein
MHPSDHYLSGGSLEDLRKIEMDPLHGYAKTIQHGIIGRGLNGMEELRQPAKFLRAKSINISGDNLTNSYFLSPLERPGPAVSE